MSTFSPTPEVLAKSRGWLIAGGILSLLVGFLAISFPEFFSIVITQVIGIFALVSGGIALSTAIFGHHPSHRVMMGLSGILRIVVGLVLIFHVYEGMTAIMLVIAILFMIEGVIFIAGSFKMTQHQGWMLLNGFITLALGVMLYVHWPNTTWALGLLYGISSIFSGMTMLTMGLNTPKPAAS